MKRDLSWGITTAVALAAVVGISTQRGGRPDEEVRLPSAAAAQVKTPNAKDQFEQGPCTEIEKHLQDFLLQGKTESRAAPVSCYPSLNKLPQDEQKRGDDLRKAAQNLQFVIATLPDPAHSHLSLSFDRATEAIQEAASDDAYVYDSSWLPWETQEAPYALLKDKDEAEDRRKRQEEQPGILLFRHRMHWPDQRKLTPDEIPDHLPLKPDERPNQLLTPDEIFGKGMVVFVVGEEPTQGIHRTQFMNAAAWIAALHKFKGSQPPTYMLPNVGILGPTFTGSLPSLASLLQEGDLAKQLQGGVDPMLIYSGTITGDRGFQWFQDSTPVAQGHMLLASFQRSDDSLMQSYCKYLLGEGFALPRLAIVSEDETAYGAALDRKEPPTAIAQGRKDNPEQRDASDQPSTCFEDHGRPTGLLRLFYPRGIAALRSAYQKESIFTSEEQSSTGTKRKTLSSDIADPKGQQHDTIREYNTSQLPQSQEGVLQQLVSQLRAHYTEYIVLRSSNPLDQLFLAHYLRESYPHGRIVILGADVLLRRESGAARLSGIMTLTTYPLLAWEPHWTRGPDEPDDHSHRIYPQDSAKGTYVAMRFLLHGLSLTNAGKLKIAGFVPTDPTLQPPIPDYAPTTWSRVAQTDAEKLQAKTAEPPTGWLSVLGRDDFWPVAALKPEIVTPKSEVAAPKSGISMPEIGAAKPGVQGASPQPKQFCDTKFGKAICWVWPATLSLEHVLYFPAARPSVRGNTSAGQQAPMPLSMKVTLFALLLWMLFHLACCSLSSLTSGPNHRSYFVCPPGNYRQHRTLLLIGCVALSCAATTLAFGCGVMSRDDILPEGAEACALMTFLLWILGGAALAINLVRESRLSSARRPAWSELPGFLRKQWPLFVYAAGTLAYHYALYWATERKLSPFNRIPAYWRSMNLTNGVSPVVPFLAISIGVYLWVWRSLQGLAFFGPDAPVVPSSRSLKIPVERQTEEGVAGKIRDRLNMFSSERAADPVLDHCKPLTHRAWIVFVSTLAAQWILGWLLFNYEEPIRSLGARSYAQFVCFLITSLIAVMLTNASQLLWIWIGLRRLLVHLDRLPLRRSMVTISGVSWSSVWKISGNVLDLRNKLLTNLLERATHVENALNDADKYKCAFWNGDFGYRNLLGESRSPGTLCAMHTARAEFGDWYAKNWDNASLREQNEVRNLQNALAEFAGQLTVWVLYPAWRCERDEQFDRALTGKQNDGGEGKDEERKAVLAPHVRQAEELVCYVYLGFIQNVLGRMRTLVTGIAGLFIAATIAMACYPFDPRTVVNAVMILLFVVLGTVIVIVYAQMHRDPVLSALTNTKPDELDGDFWLKLISFGAGPVLGLLAAVFPGITDFLFSWVAPGIPMGK